MPVDSYLFSFAQKQKKKRNIRIALISFVCVLIFLQIVFLFIIKPQRITSTSMVPELSKSSAVFVAPLIDSTTLFSQTSSLVRGTLVTIDNGTIEDKTVFQTIIDFIFSFITFQQYSPFETMRWGDSEIYRVVGIPGDTLYIDNYIAYIKEGGSSHFLTEFELSDTNYDIISHDYPQNWNMSIGSQGKTDHISLRQGEYFLLCDNRIISTDSRIFGAVDGDDINSKVIVQYFPFNSIRAF